MRFYEVRARSVLNRVPGRSQMPFSWTINPYRGCSHACVFCFARPTHRYLGFDAGRDFEREIVVKVNAPEVLRVELARRSWKHEHVALGTNTDPYQWVEGRYRLMVGIWEALRDAANPCSVLTKSPLLLRDLPLMLQIAQRTTIAASLSIPTLDERAWRATEPHTPNPRARLEAVAELNRAGIPTGVLVAPLMPGINDAPDQLEPLLQGAVDAGATHHKWSRAASSRRGQRRLHGLVGRSASRLGGALCEAVSQRRLCPRRRAQALGHTGTRTRAGKRIQEMVPPARARRGSSERACRAPAEPFLSRSAGADTRCAFRGLRHQVRVCAREDSERTGASVSAAVH